MKTVVVSDIHANSTTALCPPSVLMEDGGTYKHNQAQRMLWDYWMKFCSTVPLGSLVIVNGDLVHGANARKDSQIITPNKAIMREIARRCIEPLAKRAGEIYFVRGTEWHESTGAEDLESVAASFRNTVRIGGQSSNWELWMNIYNKSFHFAHHIGMGNGSADKEHRNAVNSFINKNQPLPDFMVRSHRHFYQPYYDNGRWLIVTPAWQLKTAFTVKVNPMSIADIGGIIFDETKGDVSWRPVLFQTPKPQIVFPHMKK